MPKISELNAITSVANNDLLMVVHDPAGLPSTNKITVNNFVTSISNQVRGYTGSTGLGYTGSAGNAGYTGSAGGGGSSLPVGGTFGQVLVSDDAGDAHWQYNPDVKAIGAIYATTNYTALANDSVILVVPATQLAPITITLPGGVPPGKTYKIRNIDSGNGLYPVIVNTTDLTGLIEDPHTSEQVSSYYIWNSGDTETWIHDGNYYRSLGSTSNSPVFLTNANTYHQVVLKNTSSANDASGDWVAYNDQGDYLEGTGPFVDMGINSSNYDSVVYGNVWGPNDSYLYNTGGNLIIGPQTDHSIKLLAGNTNAENVRMVINSTAVFVNSSIKLIDTIPGASPAISSVYSETDIILTSNGFSYVLDTAGTFTPANNIIIPRELIIGNSGDESHLVVDAANYWTSIQWKNFTSPQDPNAAPFECQAQLLRVFSGTNAVDGHEELVAVSAVRPNLTDDNGLMITTSNVKIPDAPYNDGVGTQHNFIFGGDGQFYTPGNNIIIGTTMGPYISGNAALTVGSYLSDANDYWAQGTQTYPNSLQIYTYHANTLVETGASISLNADGNSISLDANNVLPSIKSSNQRTGSGYNLRLGDGLQNQQIIISSAQTSDAHPTAQRMVIAGADGTGYGEGGDIYLWAGRSGADGGSGGDIKVDAGNAYNSEGGTIKIRGGSTSNGTGGFIEIRSGDGTTGAPITLYTRNIGTSSWNEWNFDPTGSLTLPANGDIKNASGYSVIKSIPQNLQDGFNNYTLTLTDAGKHVYKNDGDGYGIEIPTNASVPFEIGTAVTIVSGNSWTYIYPANAMETELWGAGFNTTSSSFYIPNNSMATLLKIGTDKWMLSGAGLGNDI